MKSARLQLTEHLEFFAELGVSGVSRDPAWRERPGELRVGAETTEEPEDARAMATSGSEAPVEAAQVAAHPIPISMFDPVPVPQRRTGAEALAQIHEELGDCTRCKLHKQRTHIVFGVGHSEAELMFVGEAPGRDEDVQGIPFVGRSGQLLTKIIESIGLARDQVYIANVIKCRPPENRNPEPGEIRTCEPFLFGQIDAIKPKVIVALGTLAARTLLQNEDPISRMRGRVYDCRGAKLVPTFHPAFLLRSPERKRETWEDMKTVRTLLWGEQIER